LDVWLGANTISGDLELTNNDLIRMIADATASHFDPDADPVLDKIEAMKVFSATDPVAMTIAYMVVVANCIVTLAENILERAKGAGQQKHD